MGARCSGCGGHAARSVGEPSPASKSAGGHGVDAAVLPTLLSSSHTQDHTGSSSPPKLPKPEVSVEQASPACSSASTPVGFTGPIAKSLNTIVEHLWPRISKYATEVIVNEVQPQLLEKLPSALQSLSFDPALCHLGQRPLEFRRVHIMRDEQLTAQGSINNLVFQARIDWDADCSVYLRYAGAGLGIRGLRIKGVMVFELVGLMDAPPFVEGIRAFFNNRPFVDVDFQGTGEGLLNLNLIRKKILDVVTDGISDAMVLPHRIGFKLCPDADIFAIKCPPPQGILKLTVKRARDLLAKDISWFGRATSDPYVVVECGGYRFQSSTHNRTLSPSFEYTVVIPVTEVAHQRLRLELFDEDLLTHDDFLGRVSAPVERIVAWGRDEEVMLQLEDEHRERGKSGTVTVSAKWEALSIDVAGDHFNKPGLIFAGVDTASNLTRAGPGTQYWVKVSCSGILPDFPKTADQTDKVEEETPEPPPEGADGGIAGTESMKRRLAIVRKYGMSDEEAAEVLHVKPEVLTSCLMMRSDTKAAGDLIKTGCISTFQATWETGFEFPVRCVAASVVTFVLMRKVPGGSEEALGTYEAPADSLRGVPNATSFLNIEVPGTDVRLRIKLGMRYFEPSSNALPTSL